MGWCGDGDGGDDCNGVGGIGMEARGRLLGIGVGDIIRAT